MGALLYCKTLLFEWKEQAFVRKNFYENARFKALDTALRKAYRWKNPYQISKKYLKTQKKKDIYTYGETPLSVMAKIVQECQLTSEDRVIEMGAGRGRGALFLAEYVGCQVEAFEIIPDFVENFKESVPSPKIKMKLEDMFSAPFSRATAIYLYGTMLEEEQIQALARNFPKSCKIITVSYPLSDYNDEYETKKSFSGIFPWGETQIYWNERMIPK